MKRRGLLGALGAALATGGCLDSATETATRASGSPTPTAGQQATPPSCEFCGSRFAHDPCPSFSDAALTICQHSFDPNLPAIWLAPSTELYVPTDDGRPLKLTLYNQAEGAIRIDPAAWHLARESDEGWTPVAAGPGGTSTASIRPGERYQWTLTAEGQLGGNPVVESFRPGTYAFWIIGEWHRGTDRTRVECVGLVDVAPA